MNSPNPMVDPRQSESGEPHGSGGPSAHKKALGDLAREYHRDLVRFLTVKTGSRDIAEEVAQEAYAKVLALDAPEAISFLGGYVWTTAKNLALDRARDAANRARIRQEMPPETLVETRSPERHVYAEQLVELLEEAVGQLTGKFRTAFILRFIEQRTAEEVAKELGVSVRMASAYAAGALERCQAHIELAQDTRRRHK